MAIAILLSGGTGSRIGGDIPKQYRQASGRMIISYTLRTMVACGRFQQIQIVAAEEWHEQILDEAQNFFGELLDASGIDIAFSRPGETRQESIWNAMQDIAGHITDDELVLIHDAARPCVSEELVSQCLDAAGGHDGAIPVLPMKDTIYMSQDGQTISSLLDRSTLFAGQAPEAFRYRKYYDANQRLVASGQIANIHGSTEPAIMAGMDIAMIPGDESNYKITTQQDLDRFCQEVHLS